jgi:plastocyanin
MRRWAVGGVALAQLVALAWGSWVLAGRSDVEVTVFQFRPGRLDVKVGSAVTWVNQDDIDHTVTSGSPESPGGRFEARLAGKGSTTTVTFAERGVHPYFCSRHQAMRGEIRVQ